jgi:hypothetical protein
MDHTEVLHALAEATSNAQHKRAISAATPTAGKALVRIAAELARHGHGPKKPLAQAQLRLLLHPDSTHADFVKAAGEQHGEGFGSFLAGLAKGILGPVIGIGKAIFSHPAGQAAAKSLATSAAGAIAKKIAA